MFQKAKKLFTQYKVETYKDEIILILLIILSHGIWNGWLHLSNFKIFGFDVLATPTKFLGKTIIDFSVYFLNFFHIEARSVLYQTTIDAIYYPEINGYFGITILCTGIKQLIIFPLVMLFYPGPLKHKLWYIPIGIILIFLFRALLFALLGVVFFYSREAFTICHYITKYIVWAGVFFIWLFWAKHFQKKISQSG